jgi:hypothetical protein
MRIACSPHDLAQAPTLPLAGANVPSLAAERPPSQVYHHPDRTDSTY